MATRITGFTTALTDIDTTAQEYLGAIRQDVTRDYKYVKFSGTNAVAIGDCVCYVLSDTNLQTVDDANSAVGAGVAVAAHPSGSVTYGWIQIRGMATLNNALAGTTPVAGSVLTNASAGTGALTLITAAASPAVAIAVVVASKIVQLTYAN